MAIPDSNLHQKFNDRQFIASIRYRLGLPMYTNGEKCYSCGKPMDIEGDHAMHCKRDGYLISRHNGLQSTLLRLASFAGLRPKKEDNRLIPDGRGKRPGDVIIDSGTGVTTAYDITVRSPLQEAYRDAAAKDAMHTVRAAERDKYTKYRADEDGFIADSVRLVPLAFTTQGAVFDSMEEFIQMLAGELQFKWGYSVKKTSKFIFQQISATLHLHNAQAFLGRYARPMDPHVEDYVDTLGFIG